MRHLDFIRIVADEDVRYVDEKDRSYGGSWKRSGGRSAWFMLRRKIDRLLEFMRKPDTPEVFNLKNVDDSLKAIAEGRYEKTGGAARSDLRVAFPGVREAMYDLFKYLRDCYLSENIFARIRENPDGSDGTVLAEVRDLRRYLMLVEAEMMARGVVAVPRLAVRGQIEPQPVVERAPAVPFSEQHWNESSAQERRVPRFSSEGERFVDAGQRGAMREAMTTHASMIPQNQTPEEGVASNGTSVEEEIVHSPPHVVSAEWFRKNHIEDDYVAVFWTLRAPNVYVLDPFVDSYVLPRALRTSYLIGKDLKSWVIKIADVPEKFRDFFPCLQREVNAVHHDTLPEWQKSMYEWVEGETKFVLSANYSKWSET